LGIWLSDRRHGREQLVTLGSGNHFLEVGYVGEIYDEVAAHVLGLALDQVTVIIHCGSRGFGYQVCSDYLEVMDRAVKKYKIPLPDRQLACAPVNSPEGRNYLGGKESRGGSGHHSGDASKRYYRSWTKPPDLSVRKSPKLTKTCPTSLTLARLLGFPGRLFNSDRWAVSRANLKQT
jgi:hypothetical protein